MIGRAKAAARSAWFAVFPHHPYEYLGRVGVLGMLARRLPRSYVEYVERGVFTGRGGVMGAIVRAELERCYYSSPPPEQQRRMRELWGGAAGVAWHAQRQSLHADAERFAREVLTTRAPLVDALADLVAGDRRFQTVCELGTGNGMFLQWLADRLSPVRRFIGTDLNSAQIATNRVTYRGTQLEFSAAEALEWIDREGVPGTIVIACGTLECLPAVELETLLDRVAASCRPAAFGIVEPVTMDLEREIESRPRGAMTFSHNYPHLFRARGYELVLERRVPIDRRVPHHDHVVLLAVTGR